MPNCHPAVTTGVRKKAEFDLTELPLVAAYVNDRYGK